VFDFLLVADQKEMFAQEQSGAMHLYRHVNAHYTGVFFTKS